MISLAKLPFMLCGTQLMAVRLDNDFSMFAKYAECAILLTCLIWVIIEPFSFSISCIIVIINYNDFSSVRKANSFSFGLFKRDYSPASLSATWLWFHILTPDEHSPDVLGHWIAVLWSQGYDFMLNGLVYFNRVS